MYIWKYFYWLKFNQNQKKTCFKRIQLSNIMKHPVQKLVLVSILTIVISASHKLVGANVVKEYETNELRRIKVQASATSNDNTRLWEGVVLTTPSLNNGITIGTSMDSDSGRPIYAFQGIPYVDMPRRFQKTHQAKTDYEEELKALDIGSMCPQSSRITINGKYAALGNEDCLFINVYTPVIPAENNLLPVMVFIHGGEFVRGDASSYMPNSLLDEDVLLVTFHYRLGALAFYRYGKDGTYPGNLALYDQKAALKWVNKYITDFGGDKDRVTLFGQDAGSVSALYHLITDQSTFVDDTGNNITLFHAIIAQSGSPLDPFSFDRLPLRTSAELSMAVGCGDSGDEEAMLCMLALPSDDLAIAADKMAEKWHIQHPILAPGKETVSGILANTPYKLMREGNYNHLPIMLGTCSQEGSYVAGELYSHYMVPRNLTKDKNYLRYDMLPDLIQLIGIYNDQLDFVASSLYDIYLHGNDRTNLTSMTSGIIDMTGSVFYKSGTLEIAKRSADNYAFGREFGQINTADIFLYSFEYKGEHSIFSDQFLGVKSKPEFSEMQIGVTHGDDLLYLLYTPSVSNENDRITMKRMVKMWTNFATEYNPTPDGSTLNVSWQPFSNMNQEYLSIGGNLENRRDYEERYTILVDGDCRNGNPNNDYNRMNDDNHKHGDDLNDKHDDNN